MWDDDRHDDAPTIVDLRDRRTGKSFSKHKARKPHECYLCGGSIQVGQGYERRTFLEDGKFTLLKNHTVAAECEAMRRDVEDAMREEAEHMARLMGNNPHG